MKNLSMTGRSFQGETHYFKRAYSFLFVLLMMVTTMFSCQKEEIAVNRDNNAAGGRLESHTCMDTPAKSSCEEKRIEFTCKGNKYMVKGWLCYEQQGGSYVAVFRGEMFKNGAPVSLNYTLSSTGPLRFTPGCMKQQTPYLKHAGSGTMVMHTIYTSNVPLKEYHLGLRLRVFTPGCHPKDLLLFINS